MMKTNTISQPPDTVRECYDSIAPAYAERYSEEMKRKPMDVETVERFVELLPASARVIDLGCGPGEITGYLHNRGIEACGIDLSAQMINEARKLYPGVEFKTGDMLELDIDGASIGGVIAFYSIVNFSFDQARQALAEMARILKPDGILLFTYHLGDKTIRVDDFLNSPVAIDFTLFQTSDIKEILAESGLELLDAIERDPYPDVEYPSRRAYVFARKGTAD